MSTAHGYDRGSFLGEFFPDPEDRRAVESGAELLVATNRAHRLAEMRRRLGFTQAEVAERMHVRQELVSAIERAKIDASELRTLAAYVNALGGTAGYRRLGRRCWACLPLPGYRAAETRLAGSFGVKLPASYCRDSG